MNEHLEAAALTESLLDVPTAEYGQRALDAARHEFRRTLSCWACDMLTLRTLGVARPGWNDSGTFDADDLDLAA